MKYFNIPHYKALVELKRRIDRVNIAGMDIAVNRAKILEFYDRHGLEATKEAFGICRATIYKWKKILKENGNNIRSLN